MSMYYSLFCEYTLLFFFFFSSRRRHTRLVSDWSSDVCSSDLRGSSCHRPPRQPVASLKGGVTLEEAALFQLAAHVQAPRARRLVPLDRDVVRHGVTLTGSGVFVKQKGGTQAPLPMLLNVCCSIIVGGLLEPPVPSMS